jgi:hypothetical protein
MHLCICASFSNGVMVSLGMFTLDLQTRSADASFPTGRRDLTRRSHHAPREVLEVLGRDLHEAFAFMVLSGD